MGRCLRSHGRYPPPGLHHGFVAGALAESLEIVLRERDGARARLRHAETHGGLAVDAASSIGARARDGKAFLETCDRILAGVCFFVASQEGSANHVTRRAAPGHHRLGAELPGHGVLDAHGRRSTRVCQGINSVNSVPSGFIHDVGEDEVNGKALDGTTAIVRDDIVCLDNCEITCQFRAVDRRRRFSGIARYVSQHAVDSGAVLHG